jgi:hypothetical protein
MAGRLRLGFFQLGRRPSQKPGGGYHKPDGTERHDDDAGT